jgi:hypothetical protein
MEQITGSADKNLVDKWDQRLNAAHQQRVNFERQWHLNMAFYAGRQWVILQNSTVNKAGFMLSEPAPSYKWQVRHVANRVKATIRSEITKLSKEEPQFYCVPPTTEESDRAAALCGDAVAEFFIHGKYFNARRLEATYWLTVCGTSFIKTYYDETKLELDGKPGSVDFSPVTPFHLLVPNLQLTDIQEEPWVSHVRAMEPDFVEDAYGVKVEPTADTSSTLLDSRFLQSIGIRNSKAEREKMCYVKEVWVKKSKDFPKGAMFVYGEGKLLYMYEPPLAPDTPLSSEEQMEEMMEGEGTVIPPVGEETSEVPKSIHEGLPQQTSKFPYRHGRYPFAKIDHIPTGMFYSDSSIKDLIPLQKEYNRTRSIMLETRNLASKPQWTYQKGSIDPKHLNSKPGLLLAVNAGFEPPKPLEQPEVPNALPADLEILTRDMDYAASQSEINRGKTPPGVEAASAIAYLQEENDTIYHHTITSIENAVQECGSQLLSLVHDYWPEERIISITSRNQAYEVRKFKGSSLKPNMDFRVEAGSMAPRSKAAKQAFITELMKMEAIPIQSALKYLQMNETNKLYEEAMLDSRQAQRENMYMQEGQQLLRDTGEPPIEDPMMPGVSQPVYKQTEVVDEFGEPAVDPMTGEPLMKNVTINSFDNHPVHITEHENFMKTQEYEMLEPAIQKIFQDHLDEHKEEMYKEQLAQQQMAPMDEEAPVSPEQEPVSANGAGTAY